MTDHVLSHAGEERERERLALLERLGGNTLDVETMGDGHSNRLWEGAVGDPDTERLGRPPWRVQVKVVFHNTKARPTVTRLGDDFSFRDLASHFGALKPRTGASLVSIAEARRREEVSRPQGPAGLETLCQVALIQSTESSNAVLLRPDLARRSNRRRGVRVAALLATPISNRRSSGRLQPAEVRL
jgi:hypothetical protein